MSTSPDLIRAEATVRQVVGQVHGVPTKSLQVTFDPIPGSEDLRLFRAVQPDSDRGARIWTGLLSATEAILDTARAMRLVILSWHRHGMPNPAETAAALARLEGGTIPDQASGISAKWMEFVAPARHLPPPEPGLEYWVATGGKTPLHRTRIRVEADGDVRIEYRTIWDFLED